MKSHTYSAAKTLVRYLKVLSLSGLARKDFPLELETMSSSSSPRFSLVSAGSFPVLFVSALLPADAARACKQSNTKFGNKKVDHEETNK